MIASLAFTLKPDTGHSISLSLPQNTGNSNRLLDDVTTKLWVFFTRSLHYFIVHSTKLLNLDWSRALQLIPNCTLLSFHGNNAWEKEMADSPFAILMASFLPNKDLFTNFVMFNHAWKHEEDRWTYFHCHTKLNLRGATIFAWFWWLCDHVNRKITSFSYSS